MNPVDAQNYVTSSHYTLSTQYLIDFVISRFLKYDHRDIGIRLVFCAL